MNLLKSSGIVLGAFNKDYYAHGQMRISVVNDSVIRVCGLRRFSGGFFDVYYAAIPVFSQFSLDDRFLDDASAAPVLFDPLPIMPDSSDENSVICAASTRAQTAFEKLKGVNSIEDLVSFYKQETESLLDMGVSASTRYYLNDAMIYLGEHDELESLLERCVTVAVKNVFQDHNVPFPIDGDWRRYLPMNAGAAPSEFEDELICENEGNWEELRHCLSQKNHAALNRRLLENYYVNKRLLMKCGITISEESDRRITAKLKSE